jgi:hypothetical protein
MKPLSPLWIALLISAGVVLRLLFALSTPIGGTSNAGRLSSYNDEYAHASYVEFVLRHGALPAESEPITNPDAVNRAIYENYQPPLYYLVVAAACSMLNVLDMHSIIIVGRLFSIALFIAMAWLYLCVVAAIALESSAALSGLIFLSLGGVFVRFSSMLNNEALFWVISGFLILMALRIEKRGFQTAACVGFAVAAILGLYTKLSILILLPIPLFLWNRKDRRDLYRLLGIYAAIVLATLPLWLRNVDNFGGLLPLAAGFGAPVWQIPFLDSWSYVIRSSIFPWSEFWNGMIGAVLMLPFIVFFFLNSRFALSRLISNTTLTAAIGLSFMGFLWLNLHYSQAEARYLYAAWPAVILLTAGRPLQRLQQWLWLAAVLLPYMLLFIPLSGTC